MRSDIFPKPWINQEVRYIFRTEVVDNNLSPKWKEFEIEAAKFNNGDRTREMRFRVFDWDSDGS